MTLNNPIKTLIVDDEVAFINTLSIMLEPFKRFTIIGKARSTKEAIASIKDTKPNVLFLDVQLGDGTGFDVLNSLPNLNKMKVIFVTAFDHYAVQAFRYSAIDYLLKPIVRADLISTLEKVEQSIMQDELDNQYKILLENLQEKKAIKKRIVLKEVNTQHVIQIDDILMCQAEGSYTKFYLENGESIVISRHLKEFEEMLPESIFFRVHRSYLINLDKIIKYERSEGGILMLHGGRQIPVSVRKREQLSHILSNL